MTQGAIIFVSGICGLGLLFAGLFFWKQRKYKKMYVNLVESIFILRKKQLHETFTLFFELCSYYKLDDDNDYLVWLEDQEILLKELMYRLNMASVYNWNMSLTVWFRTRDNMMGELTDFSLDLLAHPYVSKKDDVLCAVDKCVRKVYSQENYFDFDYFEYKYNMDWLIHIDKTNTVDFCADAKSLIQKEIDLLYSKNN